MKILLVCTGNTCRSPMAAALLTKLLEQRGIRAEVRSAGVSAGPGWPASQGAVEAMAIQRIDLTQHQSTPLDQETLADASYILTMEEGHKQAILRLHPRIVEKTFTLKEAGGGSGSIPDPIGGSLQQYQEVAQEIGVWLERFIDRHLEGERPLQRQRWGSNGEVLAIGSDHGGFSLKQEIIQWAISHGYQCEDFGTHSPDAVDYPDIGFPVAQSVARGEMKRGILICGTGIGMSIVANKVPGIRAALCHDTYSARLTREHNDSNILVMGARVIGAGPALDIVKIWLETAFAGGRHIQRIQKITGEERGPQGTNC